MSSKKIIFKTFAVGILLPAALLCTFGLSYIIGYALGLKY